MYGTYPPPCVKGVYRRDKTNSLSMQEKETARNRVMLKKMRLRRTMTNEMMKQHGWLALLIIPQQ